MNGTQMVYLQLRGPARGKSRHVLVPTFRQANEIAKRF